jgi:branched-chain amino acid transport system permease protein
MAGVLYGIKQQFVQPDESSLGLTVSITYLAVVIIGGIGTTYGPVIGALVVGSIPRLVQVFSADLPFIGTDGGITEGEFVAILNALLIIIFLVTEPNGVAGMLRRVKAYFASWPL